MTRRLMITVGLLLGLLTVPTQEASATQADDPDAECRTTYVAGVCTVEHDEPGKNDSHNPGGQGNGKVTKECRTTDGYIVPCSLSGYGNFVADPYNCYIEVYGDQEARFAGLKPGPDYVLISVH
jgi:hypothetical protein